MIGTSGTTGKHLSGIAHLAQSINDIITTRIGSRVLRRDYGCAIHDYIDAPMNAQNRLLMYAAIASALGKWEPRLKLNRVELVTASEGVFGFEINGTSLELGDPVSIEVQV